MKTQQLPLICAGCGEVIEKLNSKLDAALCDDCVFWADNSIHLRKYNSVVAPVAAPLCEGVTPTATSLEPKLFIAVAPNGHVLSEKEWSDVMRDNIEVFGGARAPISPYSLEELRIFNSPFSEEAKKLICAADTSLDQIVETLDCIPFKD